MNPRATIFLLLLTVAAVAAVFWVRHSVRPTRESEENGRYAAVFDAEAVREIDITRPEGKISLRKETGAWRLHEPVEDRASPEAVERLLMAARFMEVRDCETDRNPENFPEAALTSPRLRIELRGEGSTRLDIGAVTALPQQVFARSDSREGVLRVADTLAVLASAAPEEFRDRRLTEFTSDDIEKFTVRRSDGEMTLRRERGGWVIEKPVGAPADTKAVREFLDPLLGLRVLSFGAPKDGADSELQAQEAAIAITPRGGGEQMELRVDAPSAADPSGLRAFFGSRGGEMTVEAAASSLFDVSPEQLRDRSLGYADIDTVDRIRLEADGKTVTLRREGDDWVGDTDGLKRDAAAVAKLFDAFNEAKVGGFRTAQSAETTGLATPARRIAFYAWLSENTAEDTAGGHLIAGADFGHSTPDGGFYARSAPRGETVTIPADLPEAVRTAVFPPEPVNSPR